MPELGDSNFHPRRGSDAHTRRKAGEAGKAGEGERRRGGLVPIQDALDAVLNQRGFAAPKRDNAVFRAWRKVAGEELAQRAKPARFRSGELVIEVASSSLLYELRSYAGEDLRTRANAALGSERIRRVVFKPETRR